MRFLKFNFIILFLLVLNTTILTAQENELVVEPVKNFSAVIQTGNIEGYIEMRAISKTEDKKACNVIFYVNEKKSGESSKLNTNEWSEWQKIGSYTDKNSFRIGYRVDGKCEVEVEVRYIKDVSIINSFIDTRDNKLYKTVKINNQIWMAENLNFETEEGSWCYDNSAIICNKFGRLYNWKTANEVCPDGWRLPNRVDFDTLLFNVGGVGTFAYNSLIPGGSSGFYALFGGWRHFNEFYYYLNNYGYWWSSTQDEAPLSWGMHIRNYSHDAYVYYYSEDLGMSVRCIKE